MRRNEFVRYCTRIQTNDLGAAIGKITHDAMSGEAAVAVIDFTCRVPFYPEVRMFAVSENTDFKILKSANVRGHLIRN